MRFSTPSPLSQVRKAVARRKRPQSLPQGNITRIICYSHGFLRQSSSYSNRETKVDGRVRLSNFWVPSGGIAASSAEDPHMKLVRAGFLRQAHSGIFHMLPLGRRVQDKVEALIDRYMHQLGASKLALSSISSEEMWSKSGRMESVGSELFRFRDRRDVRYLLSPTHEEEITSLVSSTVKSYKELPIRLYQISRKYRDERRPRHGLLRSREFTMKDLYTFDLTPSLALSTYEEVRKIYARLFDELKLPYLVAEADSGDMGGNLSHEFHFPTSKGEDRVVSCSNCDYVANEEIAEIPTPKPSNEIVCNSSGTTDGVYKRSEVNILVWRGISRDRRTLFNVWYPSTSNSSCVTATTGSTVPEVNVRALKAVADDLDASVEDPLSFWENIDNAASEDGNQVTPVPLRLINFLDCRLPHDAQASIRAKQSHLPFWPMSIENCPQDMVVDVISQDPYSQKPFNLLRIIEGDPCPRCSDGKLKVQKAIELGHTFHLGTRYSEPLEAIVTVPTGELTELKIEASHSSRHVPMQMGCHGIGVSRMIGAVADTLADDKGLNWPRVMAPFEVVVIPSKGLDEAALAVYDVLSKVPTASSTPQLDLVLDDRAEAFSWKMQDADLVGYPIIVVVGRRWKAESVCEVQCRRLRLRQEIPIGELADFIGSVLSRV